MENDDLVRSLRAMSRYEHDDLSIGNDAADEIERLRNEVISLTARLWNCQHEHPVDAIARRSDVGY